MAYFLHSLGIITENNVLKQLKLFSVRTCQSLAWSPGVSMISGGSVSPLCFLCVLLPPDCCSFTRYQSRNFRPRHNNSNTTHPTFNRVNVWGDSLDSLTGCCHAPILFLITRRRSSCLPVSVPPLTQFLTRLCCGFTASHQSQKAAAAHRDCRTVGPSCCTT